MTELHRAKVHMDVKYSKNGIDLLRQLMRCREIDKHLSERSDLTVDEMHCVTVIYLDKPSCVKYLRALVGLTAARTSKVILSLERKGFVTRTVDSADHRKEQIKLTIDGINLAENILILSTEISNTMKLSDQAGWSEPFIFNGATR